MSATRSLASVAESYPLFGFSVSPMPRWSTAMTVKSRASAGISARYWYQFSGQPCTSSSGGPSPPMTMCWRSPPALTNRLVNFLLKPARQVRRVRRSGGGEARPASPPETISARPAAAPRRGSVASELHGSPLREVGCSAVTPRVREARHRREPVGALADSSGERSAGVGRGRASITAAMASGDDSLWTRTRTRPACSASTWLAVAVQSGVDEELLEPAVRRDARSLHAGAVGRDGVAIDVAVRAAALLAALAGEGAHRFATGVCDVGVRADGHGVGGRRAGEGADRGIARVSDRVRP